MLRLPHPVVTAQRNALAAALEISMRRAERAEAEVQVARMLAERRPPVMIPQQRNAEDPRPPK